MKDVDLLIEGLEYFTQLKANEHIFIEIEFRTSKKGCIAVYDLNKATTNFVNFNTLQDMVMNLKELYRDFHPHNKMYK